MNYNMYAKKFEIDIGIANLHYMVFDILFIIMRAYINYPLIT